MPGGEKYTMKILEISSAFPPSRGGVEMTVSELSHRLAEMGHEVTVITSTRGGDARYSDEFVGKVRVIRLPERLHVFEAPILPQIAYRALFLDFDILHVHGMSPTITDLGILVGKIKRKPVVLTYHNDAESTMDWGVAKAAAKMYARLCVPIVGLANSIICATDSYGTSSPVLRHFRGRMEVIPLGVDVTRFSNPRSRVTTNGRKEVLFVGQLKEYKGVNFLIEAIARLRQDGADVTLSIAGEGPSYPRLRAMVEALGIGESVRFLGNLDNSDLADSYDSCDLVVLPSISRREAFGLVQLEASAAGKAVVASDIPGVSDVTRRVGGYLAKPSDADSLAMQIARALGVKQDPERFREAAAAMGWDKVTVEYEELFQTLLKPQGPATLEPSSQHGPLAPLPELSDSAAYPRVKSFRVGPDKTRASRREGLTYHFENLAGWVIRNSYIIMGAAVAILVSIYLMGSFNLP
jgi:glycosyltransferase involved in cell wall biosynthesis